MHDIGGMDGFGRVHRENGEPVFHQRWEGRVFGMLLTGGGLPPTPIDVFRHRGERLDPLKYLDSSYYERWLAAMEAALIEAGTLSRKEIEAKVEQFTADPALPVPRREDPTLAENISRSLRAGNPVTRNIRQKARFAADDKIVTRNLNPHGHTRLPRYARARRGVIVAHHGAHVFPDTNAHGLGENPQHLYTVRFAARELWGASAEPNTSVLVDLWESYLEKDNAAGKSRKQGLRSTRRQAVPKISRHSSKPRQVPASSKASLGPSSGSIKLHAAGGRSKSAAGATADRRSTRGRNSRRKR